MAVRIPNFMLKDRCDIKAVSQSLDSYNQPISSSSTTQSSIRCLLVKRTAKELKDTNSVVVADYRLLLPFGTSIAEKDQVVSSGVTYEVEFVNLNPGHADSFVEVLIKKVG